MNKELVTQNRRKRGFSLLELTIVLTIVGILLYATVAVGLTQIEIAKVKATQDKLDKINNAITLFLKTNGYLPCPAATNGNGTVSETGGSTTCAATGILRDAGSNVWIGVLPSRALNLSDDYMYDSWGNRITYVVSKYCVASTNWNTAYPSTNTHACAQTGPPPIGTNGNTITIRDTGGTPWPNLVAYVAISHGKNGYGAWNRAGTKVTGTATVTDYVLEKTNGNLTTAGAATCTTACSTSYNDATFNDGTILPAYFDDIVRWRTALQLNYDANH